MEARWEYIGKQCFDITITLLAHVLLAAQATV